MHHPGWVSLNNQQRLWQADIKVSSNLQLKFDVDGKNGAFSRKISDLMGYKY